MLKCNFMHEEVGEVYYRTKDVCMLTKELCHKDRCIIWRTYEIVQNAFGGFDAENDETDFLNRE